MTAPVAIVDYGMGNIRSVQNAIEAVGSHGDVVAMPEYLADYERIVLPGVGAFAQAMIALRSSGMATALEERRKVGTPILGICLGMQIMCTDSEEDGHHVGLGWIDAHVKRLPSMPELRVPHMGWNTVHLVRPDSLLDGLHSENDAYFVHSYRVECKNAENVLATTDYGETFASMILLDNVRGVQFHPEKSQSFGLALISKFLSAAF